MGLLLPLAVAVSACTDRAGLDASASQLSLHVADAALAAGAPDLALHVTDSVLAPHPRDLDALATKGDALYMKGQLEDAEQAYRAALATDPGSARGQIGLGRILLRTDPAAAEAAFLHALQREPRNVTALSNLGVARDLQERHADAQLAYRQALDLAPDNPATLASLGLSLALSGDAAAGLRILQPLASGPTAPSRLRDDLAVALTLGGDTAGATRILGSDLSQPETATAIAGYRALATPGQAIAVLGQDHSLPTDAAPTASASRTRTEQLVARPAPVAPFSLATASPADGLLSDQPPAPATERPAVSVASLPDVLSPVRPLPPAIEPSAEGLQSDGPPDTTRPNLRPILPAIAAASPKNIPETPHASTPIAPEAAQRVAAAAPPGIPEPPHSSTPIAPEAAQRVAAAAPPGIPEPPHSSTPIAPEAAQRVAAARPDVAAVARTTDVVPPTEVAGMSDLVAPSIMDLTMLLRAIEAGRSVGSSTADTVPALPAAPKSLWLATAGVDITMPFAAIGSNAPPDGAMLAVALPTEPPATDAVSWLGASWSLAIAQLPAPTVPTPVAAVPSSAQVETVEKPPAERASVAQMQQPYVQVAALDSQQAASSEWEQLRAKMPDLLSGRSPTVQQAEVNGRMYWRLRTTGFVTLAEANAFCGRLQATGSDCWTMLAAPPP